MGWTNSELFEALKLYEQQCESANLADATVHSYVNYARMFLRWRINDFRSDGASEPARELRIDPVSIAALDEDLRAYDDYLRAAGRQPTAVQTYVVHARQFVHWLDARFIPGARRQGSFGQATRGRLPLAPAARQIRTNRPVPDLPSDNDVRAKRKIYATAEPRDLAYKVARRLIEQARGSGSEFSAGDGVAILLMSWNAGFYRFRPGPVRTLAADLDQLITTYQDQFDEFRARSIATFDEAAERNVVETLYREFLAILWPVGTAKALHVLAPSFFPIWDTAIAAGFRLTISPPERSVESYLDLMRIARSFVSRSGLSDPLKAFDEWAYVTFTLRQ